MAQTTQIVPKFSFPYVETHVNDYTQVTGDYIEDTVDTTIKQIYAVTASKGIDNTWIKKTSKASAIKTFGDSNFAKYGQPLMQALNVLDNDNVTVYMMRVMPEDAAYSHAIISAGYKVDESVSEITDTMTVEEVAKVLENKFKIKLTSAVSVDPINTAAEMKATVKDTKTTLVGEYSTVPYMALRYSGRGVCGDAYSVRISQANTYEKEYGIKLYDFEVMCSDNGLSKDSDYVGSMVTTTKYNDGSVTFINDLLEEVEAGLAPVDVYVNENNFTQIYDAYVTFIKKYNGLLEKAYARIVVASGLTEEEIADPTTITDEAKRTAYNYLVKIEEIIDSVDIPDADEFDIVFGRQVASTDMLAGVEIVTPVDEPEDTTIVDFSSTKGVVLAAGSDGSLDSTSENYDEVLSDCYTKAFDGTYDSRILSVARMPLTIVFDANYPFAVKQTIADLVLTRGDCPVRFDVGVIDSISISTINTLDKQYASFNDRLESIDIHNYDVKDPATNKKCTVTYNYFLASRFVYHYNNNGFHIPFVKEVTKLTGHVRDSLRPVIDDYNTDIKEALYNKRFNYCECIRENVFQRAVQNTRQSQESDLLEENNVLILCELKKEVEYDTTNQIYNFADESVRQAFVNTQNAKYSDWNSRIVQSIEFSFATSEYEFNHSILHLYVAVVFRGLTKRAIIEIDINKRQYSTSAAEE